jgi:hypothetical protein
LILRSLNKQTQLTHKELQVVRKVQLAGKSKVTRLKAKTGIIYPLIRLPKTFADEIGKTAEMYKIENGNYRTLFITFSNSFGSKEVVQLKPKVIQPEPKVIQLNCQKDFEERLLELESEIKELKSLLLLNELDNLHRNKNAAHFNGPGAIRTPDLRRVKTEVLGVFEAFSVGDITVRNANAPS